jgi:hypothetical protein
VIGSAEPREQVNNNQQRWIDILAATALLRFWTLAMLAYVFLEEERQRLQTQQQRPVTIGEARREIQRRLRRNVLLWLHAQFQSGVQPHALYDLFAA